MDLQREHETSHPLRREAVLPSSAGPARPCLLVGLSLVALCLAASLDAFLWHQARDREDAELQLQQAKAQARDLAAQVVTLRKEVARYRAIDRAHKQARLIGDLERAMKNAEAAIANAKTPAERKRAQERLNSLKPRFEVAGRSPPE